MNFKIRDFLVIIVLSFSFGCQQQTKPDKTKANSNIPYFYWAVDWHPNKNQIVVGGTQDTLRLLSSNDLKVLKNIPYKGTITKAKWHPTKDRIAVSVQDGRSYSSIIDMDDGSSIQLDSIGIEGARGLSWNSTGDLLALGDNNGFIILYDENGKFQKKIHTTQKGIMDLDWHPEKNIIVAVGEKITIYNYESDSLKHINDRSEDVEVLMLCVAWHPSGECFVTGDYGDFQYDHPPLLQYWAYDGNRIKTIIESRAEYRNLEWSSDGEVLASASDKIRLWDKNGHLLAEKPSEALLWGVDWNSENTKIVGTDDVGEIILWDNP